MTTTPRSLFLVALPRSLSTVAYELCCRALDLRAPAWADAGEILNGDRIFLLASALPHFLEAEDGHSRMLREFLDDLVQPRGRAYKDVVQPLIVSRWLAERDDLAVLHLRRPLADVAWAMVHQDWRYPERLGGSARAGDEADDRLLRGLLRAHRALDDLQRRIGAQTLDFDDLLQDEEALLAALRQLYPEAELTPVRYLDDSFRQRRDKVLARRRRDDWRRLSERLEALAEHLAE